MKTSATIFSLFLFFSLSLWSCQRTIIQPGYSEEPATGILFVSDRGGNWDLYLIQPDGSALAQLTDHPDVDADPAWSPDGHQIVFRSQRDGNSDIFIMGADGSSPVNLIQDEPESWDDEFAPNWQPNGDLLVLFSDRPPFEDQCRIGGVHQLAFMSIHGGKETIEQAPFVLGEQQSNAWSPDGRQLVFSSICNQSSVQLYIWDLDTQTLSQLTDDTFPNFNPAWSPDGQFIAFTSGSGGNSDIWIINLETRERVNITNHPARDTHATWSPDGQQIAFRTNRDGNDEIYIMNYDGSNPINLTNHPGDDFWPAWSPIP